jgi:hypothetical protein
MNQDATPSLENFNRCEWQRVIAECRVRECVSYGEAFGKKALELEGANDPTGSKVFQLLRDVSFFRLDASNRLNPFKTLMSYRGRRSALPADITDDDLGALRELTPTVEDAEFRARLADLIWVRTRNVRFARTAVAAYLESAAQLESNQLSFAVARLERALRVSAMLNDDGLLRAVAEAIEALLGRQVDRDPLRCVHLLRLLREFQRGLSRLGMGKPLEYADCIGSIAQAVQSRGDFESARELHKEEAEWLRLARQTDGNRAAQIAAAETYVLEADRLERGNPPNYSLVAERLEKAVTAHQRIAGQRDRSKELYGRLVDAQEKATQELRPVFLGNVNVSLPAEAAIAAVSGRTLYEALTVFASFQIVRKVTDMRAQVESLAREFPLIHALRAVTVSETGKNVGKRPSMLSQDPAEREEAIKSWMFEQSRRSRAISVHGLIAPAAEQILLEHPVDELSWLPIAAENPFIPPGRELIFVRGLHAGLNGDLLVAAHLLIPQLENSFRCVLQEQRVNVSKIDTETGIQREMYIQELLRLEEFKQIFGEDLAFDLIGLLVERGSSNLRHSMAHGLLSYGDFSSTEVLYFWWVVLRLCILSNPSQACHSRGTRSG